MSRLRTEIWIQEGGDSKVFTDQKPWVVTEEETRLRWSGGEEGKHFRCYLCGHKFRTGDTARWVYGGCRTFEVEGHKYGAPNFLVCDKCDHPEVLDTWVNLLLELYTKYWWMVRDAYEG